MYDTIFAKNYLIQIRNKISQIYFFLNILLYERKSQMWGETRNQ